MKRLRPLRHTFATNALAAGISVFDLSRYMGTSIEMIDRTYGHLAADSEQAARDKLDAIGGLAYSWCHRQARRR